MARTTPYGYYYTSTNKYGRSILYPGEGPWYGGVRSDDTSITTHHIYGLNYPPPVPTSFTVEYWPTTSDHTPRFMWNASDPESASLVFIIELNYETNDFSSPTITTASFSATALGGALGGWIYELPIEYKLDYEGTYFARIKSSDGYTWSDYSDVLEFEYALSSPPSPTIDAVTSPTDQFVQLITGTKTPNSYVYIRNNSGEWEEVTYTNGRSGGLWYYSMTLVAGVNYIEAIASWSISTTVGVSAPAVATIHTIFLAPSTYNVWNCFDELGMLVSLDRIAGEKNKAYKQRILDVYANPGNSTHQGLINAISRELGIAQSEVSVYRLSDLSDEESSGSILNSDGNAIGTKLEEYVDEVYSHNPIFWGNLVSDEGLWDVMDEEYTGVSYLPHIWDPSASGIYDKWQRTGIGDNDDLWVKSVEEITDPSGAILGTVTGEGMMAASGVLRDDTTWRLMVHSGYFYVTEPSGSHYWS